MKAMKWSVAVVALAAVAACGEERDGGAPAQGASQELILTTAYPTYPSMPRVTTLAMWDSTPLYDRTHSYFYTVYGRSPDDPTHFRAYGIDVRYQTIAFHIDLDGWDELARMQDRVRAEIDRIAQSRETAADKIHHGGTYEIDKIPPPPPDPCCWGGDWWAGQLVKLATANTKNAQAAFSGQL